MNALTNLLDTLNMQVRPGVSEEELRIFEQRTGLNLPVTVRELYRTTNGGRIDAIDLEILPLEQVERYIQSFRDFGIPAIWGYVPFTESNDSNPFCVCCTDLLPGYIVRFHHDDAAQLMFRDLTQFLTAIQQEIGEGAQVVDDIASSFKFPNRSETDFLVAHHLMQTADTLEDIGHQDALRFAITLFSESHIAAIAAILRSSDEAVREVAVQRLRDIGTQEAKDVIDAYEADFRQFVRQCAEALVHSGIRATIAQENKIRVDPGPIWLNTELFYTRRHEPHIIDFVLERAKTFLDRRR